MRAALAEARVAGAAGEVPVGAVIVAGGRIIARSHNLTELLTDVTAHAEIQAITAASNYLGNKYLQKCTLDIGGHGNGGRVFIPFVRRLNTSTPKTK